VKKKTFIKHINVNEYNNFSGTQITVVGLLVDNDQYLIYHTVCAPNDQFSKKKGVEIAMSKSHFTAIVPRQLFESCNNRLLDEYLLLIVAEAIDHDSRYTEHQIPVIRKRVMSASNYCYTAKIIRKVVLFPEYDDIVGSLLSIGRL
jgi:hypothetical protein